MTLKDPNSGAEKLTGYAFLVVFANDDAISTDELHMLEKIALEDKAIDRTRKGFRARYSHASQRTG